MNLVNIPRKNSKDGPCEITFLRRPSWLSLRRFLINTMSQSTRVTDGVDWPALAPPSQRNSHRRQQWLAVDPTDLVSSAGSRDCPACLAI